MLKRLNQNIKTVPFGTLIESISGGATPLRAKEEQYCDSGIKFLRIQNIKETGFDFSDVKYITEEVHENLLKRSQLSCNDLLMTITGRIGTCAVVDSTCLPANINQHIVRIRLVDGIDSNFAAAYLNSKLGNLLSNRGVTGTTRIALDYESIKKIPFPIIDNPKQIELVENLEEQFAKINEKIKKAEKQIIDNKKSIEDRFNLNKSENKLCFAVRLKNIDGVIDVKRYSTIGNLEHKLVISDICDVVDERVNVSSFGNCIVDWIRIDDLQNQPLDIEQVRTMPATEIDGTFFEVQKDDILVARLGPTILNQKIVMVRNIERTTIASSEFLVLRCKKGYNPEAVMSILKTDYYMNLMYSNARGSTPSRYRLNRADMLKLPFPDIAGVQDEVAENAISARETAKKLRVEAEQEWQAAKAQFEKELLGE